jgi:hypothetical protein
MSEIEPIFNIYSMTILSKRMFDEEGKGYYKNMISFYTGLEPQEGYPKVYMEVYSDDKLIIEEVE